MTRTLARGALAATLLLALAACRSEGPAERTGAAIDRAGSRTGAAVGRAAENTGDALERAGDWVRDRTR